MHKMSEFVHVFDLGDHIALWHSLRMKPVFIEKACYDDLLENKLNSAIEKELIEKKILLRENEDQEILNRLRRNIPTPDVGLAYFILSENCNLACRYCFVGSDVCGKGMSLKKDMTKEIAEKAIDVFARQLETSATDYTRKESNIIFFGGEPLLNFEVLRYVARRVNTLALSRPVLSQTKLSVITNGTLLNEEKILELDKLGVAVSISIDGFTDEANEMRVDKAGNATFARVIDVLEKYSHLGVEPPSLSVTLSDKTIEDLSSMVRLIKEYGIRGFGYNVLLKVDDNDEANDYYERASQFIIDSFIALRCDGVYEDRIMRKLNAFAHSRIHFSDCGATSGGQVLFAPDGRIGICQGLMADSENYVSDIWDDDFIAAEHPVWKSWAELIPINNEECLSCEALGLCGGGCPVNARIHNPAKGLHCVDARSCVHSRQTLKFLIEELYKTARARSRG